MEFIVQGDAVTDRAVEIAGFLSQQGWEKAQQTPFPADFSPRRYARLVNEYKAPSCAILMDADRDQKTPQFVAIANLLRSLDLSAPEIYASDPDRGLVLMEDFGDRNYGNMIDVGDDAKPYYMRAVDVLVHLHQHYDVAMTQDLSLPRYEARLFIDQSGLFLDAYFLYKKGREAHAEERTAFYAAWQQSLGVIENIPQTLMLRDFMLDNLMDLPARAAWRAVGLLDFQDAGLGPIAYDLASLCEDVRRDGGDRMLDQVIDYYYRQSQPPYPLDYLRSACRVLAAQRHVRILGILVRLAVGQGRRDKLAYVPRIWGYLDYLLQDKVLEPLRLWMRDHITDEMR